MKKIKIMIAVFVSIGLLACNSDPNVKFSIIGTFKTTDSCHLQFPLY